MQADRPIKPQPTNEKCWRQADRRIKSDQPIRESRVFRAQTARQLANQRKQGLSRPNCEAAGSDYKKTPPRTLGRLRQSPPDSARLRQSPPVSARLRQTPPDSVRLRRASQSCDCDERCNFAGLCSRDAGLTHHQTSLDETGHRWTRAEVDATECECYTTNLSLSLSG